MTKPSTPSGLRNPVAAVRGVGAGGLVAQGLVLLLAIVPLKVLGAHWTGLAIASVVMLAVASLVLAGMLRRPWAWYVSSALPPLIVLSGLVFQLSLVVVGLLFGLLWAYVLHVRRNVLQ